MDEGRRATTAVSALDAMEAALLITKHLDALLPFLLALKRVPARLPQRVGLLQSIARDVAGDPDLARDWYRALELLVGDDLSARSAADLLILSVEHLSPNGRLGDVWGVAHEIGLLDERSMGQWVLFSGLIDL